MMLYLIGFVAVLVTLLCRYIHRSSTYWQRHGVPSVAGDPLLGNMTPVLLQRANIFQGYDRLYNDPSCRDEPVFGVNVFMQPALMLRDPELIKRVLVKDFAHFSNRYTSSDPHSDALGAYNLFVVNQPEWSRIRARITPFFTSGKLRQMYGLMTDVGKELHSLLQRDRADEVMETKELFARFSTDIIASCAYGVTAHSLKDGDSAFRRYGREIFEYTWYRSVEFTGLFLVPASVAIFRFKVCRLLFLVRLRLCSTCRKSSQLICVKVKIATYAQNKHFTFFVLSVVHKKR